MFTSLSELGVSGVGLIKKLNRLGISTLGDLLTHFPRRYEDWTQPRLIGSLRIGEQAVIRATILEIRNERSPRRRINLTKACLKDQSGELSAVWFNQPYMERSLKPGQTFLFHGEIKFDRISARKLLISPRYESLPKILSIYPETAGLSSKQLRRLIGRFLPLAKDLTESLPIQIVNQEKIISRSKAFKIIHQPDRLSDLAKAQERFAFEELFIFSLRLQSMRRSLNALHSSPLSVSKKELVNFVKRLPFKLTEAQRRSAWEIIQDIEKNVPMNRLLQGDVGSGKTVVAAFAAYVAIKSGFRVAWMAPTEILAQQHFENVSELLRPFGITTSLITGSNAKISKADVKNLLSRKKIPDTKYQILNTNLIIGTQALLSESVKISKLGLVIVDEQHRFGVQQRASLVARGLTQTTLVPHFLSMTATPIPRTLALSLYGDLDLSIIDELPANRLPVKTFIIEPNKRQAGYRFISREIQSGRQVFVVCPVIEPSESDNSDGTLFANLEKRSAVSEYEKLKTSIFPDLRIGLIHGRLKSKDKEAVMSAFSKHELDILVSTAVIEVGIDIPNATVMVIEGADHFGLAQLHQLRGRVGRGDKQAYCFLFSQSGSPIVRERLMILEKNHNGAKIAEADLAMRGPGEFLGSIQSGLPDFKMASLFDFRLIARTRAAARMALDQKLITKEIADLALESSKHHLE